MSSELFIHKFILPFAVWGIICLPLVGIILEALARLRRPRRIEPVAMPAIPPIEIEWVTQAMDKVIFALEQDETLEWRAQYRVVEDAELVAEQHQARLAKEQEG